MGALNDYWINITCQSPALGLWVQIELFEFTVLHFHEVEALGYDFL